MLKCNHCGKEHKDLKYMEGLSVYNHPEHEQGEQLYYCTGCIKEARDKLIEDVEPRIKGKW